MTSEIVQAHLQQPTQSVDVLFAWASQLHTMVTYFSIVESEDSCTDDDDDDDSSVYSTHSDLEY